MQVLLFKRIMEDPNIFIDVKTFFFRPAFVEFNNT